MKNGAKLSDIVNGYLNELKVFDLKSAKFGKRYEAEFYDEILKGRFRKVGELLIPESYTTNRDSLEKQILDEKNKLKEEFKNLSPAWRFEGDTYENFIERRRKSFNSFRKCIYEGSFSYEFNFEKLRKLLRENNNELFYKDNQYKSNHTFWMPLNSKEILVLKEEQIC